jgi:hypothetical protein
MNEQLNGTMNTLITKLNTQETEQLNELLKYYLEVGSENRLEVLKHAQLYHAAVQLMNPAQSK